MSKKYDAIMFDLDGTLLPMDMGEFLNGYLREMYNKYEGYDFSLEEFIGGVMTGIKAMYKNDGSITNREAFWNAFTGVNPCDDLEEAERICNEYYLNEYNEAKKFTGENPLAVKAVEAAREKCDKVILATNPFLPIEAQSTRLSWVGLKPEDFLLVTSYENSRFCKPNPKYFTDICQQYDLDPSNCLMIGNDELEDMFCASVLQMDCYLVEDCIIKNAEHPWEGTKGTFKDLVEFLENL